MSDKAWVMITYLGYCTVYLVLTIGFPMYAVFIEGRNPWWLLLILLSGAGYSPWRWYSLMDGVERKFSNFTKETK